MKSPAIAIRRRSSLQGSYLERNAWIKITAHVEDECAGILSSCEQATSASLERLRFAALKLSQGDLSKLKEAIGFATVDWRDLLMNADFGYYVEAHDQ